MNEKLKEIVTEARFRKSKKIDWYEFVDIETNLCSLCGNTGIMKVTSENPDRTLELHYDGPCVCPNGRAAKKQGVAGKTWNKKRGQ